MVSRTAALLVVGYFAVCATAQQVLEGDEYELRSCQDGTFFLDSGSGVVVAADRTSMGDSDVWIMEVPVSPVVGESDGEEAYRFVSFRQFTSAAAVADEQEGTLVDYLSILRSDSISDSDPIVVSFVKTSGDTGRAWIGLKTQWDGDGGVQQLRNGVIGEPFDLENVLAVELRGPDLGDSSIRIAEFADVVVDEVDFTTAESVYLLGDGDAVDAVAATATYELADISVCIDSATSGAWAAGLIVGGICAAVTLCGLLVVGIVKAVQSPSPPMYRHPGMAAPGAPGAAAVAPTPVINVVNPDQQGYPAGYAAAAPPPGGASPNTLAAPGQGMPPRKGSVSSHNSKRSNRSNRSGRKKSGSHRKRSGSKDNRARSRSRSKRLSTSGRSDMSGATKMTAMTQDTTLSSVLTRQKMDLE